MAKFYKHPAYIGFADGSQKKKVTKRFKKQFKEQGFDETVTYSLDTCIARFILPRLEAYDKIASQHIVMDCGFQEAIFTMIQGFTLAAKDEVATEEDAKKVRHAFDSLAQYHNHLWW